MAFPGGDFQPGTRYNFRELQRHGMRDHRIPVAVKEVDWCRDGRGVETPRLGRDTEVVAGAAVPLPGRLAEGGNEGSAHGGIEEGPAVHFTEAAGEVSEVQIHGGRVKSPGHRDTEQWELGRGTAG